MTTVQSAAPYLIERCAAEEAARIAEGSVSLRTLLSPQEALFAAALKTPKRKRDWLAGRLASKRVVAAALAAEGARLALSEIEIATNTDGSPSVRFPTRPEIPGGAARWPLSLSHSASGGAAVLGRPSTLIGVDLEAVAPRAPAFVSLMAHETELTEELKRSPLEQARLWTLKEAVSKLLGVGLSVDLWDIRFPSGRLELHNKARARWEGLGRPEISFECRADENESLSIAYTGGTDG